MMQKVFVMNHMAWHKNCSNNGTWNFFVSNVLIFPQRRNNAWIIISPSFIPRQMLRLVLCVICVCRITRVLILFNSLWRYSLEHRQKLEYFEWKIQISHRMRELEKTTSNYIRSLVLNSFSLTIRKWRMGDIQCSTSSWLSKISMRRIKNWTKFLRISTAPLK